MPNGFQMGILDWETPPQPEPQPGATGKELQQAAASPVAGWLLRACARGTGVP